MVAVRHRPGRFPAMMEYAAPVARSGLGDRRLHRDRPSRRAPASGRRTGRGRCPAEALGPDPGLRHRQGRKTDATDAHSVALVGTRMSRAAPGRRRRQLAVLRILVDRRRSLGEDHTRMISQLHQLLLDCPGRAKKDLSAAQAKALLAKVRPRDVVGKTRAGSPRTDQRP